MSIITHIDQIDRSIFLEINSWHAEWLDPVMWYISQPLTWIPVYGLFLYLAYQKYGTKGIWALLLGIGLVVTLADNIHRELFKEVFERFRPSRNPELEGLVHLVTNPKSGKPYTGGRFGFISGHASNFTGIAVFVISLIRPSKMKVLFISLWALLICYSRIYLGVHYPGDLLGGICLGIPVGLLSAFLARKYILKTTES